MEPITLLLWAGCIAASIIALAFAVLVVWAVAAGMRPTKKNDSEEVL